MHYRIRLAFYKTLCSYFVQPITTNKYNVVCAKLVYDFQVEESEVVDIFERLMPSSTLTVQTREYGLTALAKLVTRFESDSVARIHALIRQYSAHMHLELQQRAVEYARLLDKDELK